MKKITSTLQKFGSNISVVLYGSMPNNRMSTFGPKCLYKINNQSILNKQNIVFEEYLGKYEILICGQFEIDKIINRGFRVIENQTETNECEDIRLALNACTNKNILLINQASVFENLAYNFTKSFVVSGSGDEEESVNGIDNLEHLTFDSNDLKWKHITFIHEKNYHKFKSKLDTLQYQKSFLFELLNDCVDDGMILSNFISKTNDFVIINPKQLRYKNENFNSIN